MQWLLHLAGLDSGNSPVYLFFSGLCGVLGAPFVLWRRYNCHVPHCHRIGRYDVPGHRWTVCARHAGPHRHRVTVSRVHEAFRRHDEEAVNGVPEQRV